MDEAFRPKRPDSTDNVTHRVNSEFGHFSYKSRGRYCEQLDRYLRHFAGTNCSS